MRKLICLALLLAGTAQAQDFIQAQMPSDRELPSYVLGSSHQVWPAGQVNWYYNPAGQPTNLSTQAVVNAIQLAASRWSGMCNVTFNYLGLTTTAPVLNGSSSTVDQINVFGWDFLLNDQAQYSAVTQTWWNGSQLMDADVVMNRSQSWFISDVQAIMTHELGHVIGISHSDVSASVMFANPYHSAVYMQVLRGDDANACAAGYGAAPTAESNRAFNWAETAYAQYLSPGPAASGTTSGYYYRYYSDTRSYVGTKDGVVYFMGADGVIQNMGPLSSYSTQVRSAGY